MSGWREKEWRIPRKGDVVKDHDGNLGIVTGSLGTLTKRRLWVSNVNDTEIHTDEYAELFNIVELDVAKKFHIQRLDIKGFREGSLCMFKNSTEIPLEVIHIEWNSVRAIPILWLQDLRSYDDNILKTEHVESLSPFDLNFPPIDTIFSSEDSGLKWRLEVNLVEVERPGWAGSGSPWEFSSKEKALEEVENWKSRLQIRRVSSVINSSWNINFPCWTIELIEREGKTLSRVKNVDSYNGFPGYFPTALHAATALKLLPLETWKRAFISSQDPLF